MKKNTRTAFGKEIAKLLIDLDMDMAEFERDAGLPEKYLSDCTWGKRNPSMDGCLIILTAAADHGFKATKKEQEQLLAAAAASQVTALKLPIADEAEETRELFFFFVNSWKFLPIERRRELLNDLKSSASEAVAAALNDEEEAGDEE